MAAGHVHIAFEADVRNAICADLLDEFVKFVDVDIALERMLARGIVSLVDDDVDEFAACQFLVQLCHKAIFKGQFKGRDSGRRFDDDPGLSPDSVQLLDFRAAMSTGAADGTLDTVEKYEEKVIFSN